MGYMYCPKDKRPLFYAGKMYHVESNDAPKPDLMKCSAMGGHFWHWSINENSEDGAWTLRECREIK